VVLSGPYTIKGCYILLVFQKNSKLLKYEKSKNLKECKLFLGCLGLQEQSVFYLSLYWFIQLTTGLMKSWLSHSGARNLWKLQYFKSIWFVMEECLNFH